MSTIFPAAPEATSRVGFIAASFFSATNLRGEGKMPSRQPARRRRYILFPQSV
jgi:hypothetical protein